MGFTVAEHECADTARLLFTEVIATEGIERDTLFLHADNGGPMKGP